MIYNTSQKSYIYHLHTSTKKEVREIMDMVKEKEGIPYNKQIEIAIIEKYGKVGRDRSLFPEQPNRRSS